MTLASSYWGKGFYTEKTRMDYEQLEAKNATETTAKIIFNCL
jgi:hypothetical protein